MGLSNLLSFQQHSEMLDKIFTSAKKQYTVYINIFSYSQKSHLFPQCCLGKRFFNLYSILEVEGVKKFSFFLIHSKQITMVPTRDLASFLTAHCLHILSQLPCAFLLSALEVFTVLKMPYIISDKKYLFKRKRDEIRWNIVTLCGVHFEIERDNDPFHTYLSFSFLPNFEKKFFLLIDKIAKQCSAAVISFVSKK